LTSPRFNCAASAVDQRSNQADSTSAPANPAGRRASVSLAYPVASVRGPQRDPI
jgi:hypothetical protein